MFRSLISRLRDRASAPEDPSGDAAPALPAVANANLPLLRPGQDPAATLARVRLVLQWLRQENARRGLLLDRPEWRRYYEEGLALERALVRKYFGRH